MSNLELRIEEEASLDLILGESSDMSFDAVDFVGVPFAPTVEVEDIEGGHRVSITSMGAEGKKTDEFDVMDGEDAATWLSGNVLFGELEEAAVLTADDAYAAPPKGVDVFGKSTQSGTPTPDAPVEINSVDDLTLHVCGKNWLDIHAGRKTNTSVAKDGSGVWYPYAVSNYLNNFSGNSLSIDGDTVTFTSKSNYGFGVEAHVLPGATYTISAQSITVSDGAAYDIRVNYFRKDGTFTYLTIGTNVNKVTTTIPSYAIYAVFAISVSANVVSTITVKGLQLELGSTATPYAPYIGQSVTVLDQPLRSLPDGTRDTVTLSYIGPSTEHEGWGVFSKVLTQRVGVATINASEWQSDTAVSIGDGWYRASKRVLFGAESVIAATATQGICTAAPFVYNASLKSEHVGTQGVYMLLVAQESTAAAIAARYDGATVIYKLATPVTHDLGTVELPCNPAPDLTAWADGGSAQPTLAMEYERALSIVIPRIEAAISDLATS